MAREYVLYTDESIKTGLYFGNFYGGALLRSSDFDAVNAELRAIAIEENLTGEIKWQKVTAQYLKKYIRLVDAFFDLMRDKRVKVRIMFTQARYVPTGLGAYQREHAYHLLYYQFLKHAFGFKYANRGGAPIRLRIYVDKLPDTREKNAAFKARVAELERSPPFRESNILVPVDQIAEVDSKKHIVLQCLDVLIGAIQFRLNNRHLEKPEGSRTRGARTIAKGKLYKHINRRICELHPKFNIGITTGIPGGDADRFKEPYRHWLFVPKSARVDATQVKPKKR
ncbi:MAG TPA: DUF3800 domain-containing protein [Thermoanaerobaculia bacterium]|nr:DUF3800 domain-containing protein [Thermoanaerobaculia bacterium]